MFKKLVMYCPQLENDAKLYAEKYGCEICPIAWNKFDENFPHIIIGDDDFSKSDVILFVSLDDYDSIFRQLSTIYALPRYRTRSFTIAMPLSSYKKLGEKVDAGVVDLKVVMHYLLNFVPFSTDGPAKIVSYVKDEDDLYFSKEQCVFDFERPALAVDMFGPAKKVFFHVGQTEKMAHALAGKFPDSGVRSVVKIASESGFSKISIENVSAAMNNDVYFIASFDTPADVIEQLGAIFTLVINGARSMNVILPFFPTATMERIEKKGEVATAKSLARMIGAIPFSADNKSLANVFFFDEHTTNLRLYFPDEVTPIPLTAIPLLLKELESIDNCEIGFPDAGAGKRFGRLIPEKFQRILGDKIRGEGDKRTVVIKEGDPAGKFVVVIDDLSRTCGTLREFCEALLNAGAAGVWVFTVHGAFNKGAWKKFVERMHEHIASGKFKKFFITDSCPIQAEEVSGHESFKVLSLVDLIYKAIS